MKKKSFILLIAPAFILSCNNGNIDIPKSPFVGDNYNRIGINSVHSMTPGLEEKEYNNLNNAVQKTSIADNYVSSYTVLDETRDLKYAYFGSEVSSVYFNTLSTVKYEHNRYKNFVNIDKTDTLRRLQVSGGENKSNTISTEFTFDTYKDPVNPQVEKTGSYKTYRMTEKVLPKEDTVVEDTMPEAKKYEESQFYLHPFVNDIYGKFISFEGKFKLLGNSAVYGKTTENKYVIKEGYSEFKDFQTKLGRNYKSVDNYFYEGLLEDITSITKSSETVLGFKQFRFYKETLILSEATNGEGVPVLYLEKPVLVWFNEITINVNYDTLVDYTDSIPKPTEKK